MHLLPVCILSTHCGEMPDGNSAQYGLNILPKDGTFTSTSAVFWIKKKQTDKEDEACACADG